MIYRMLFLTSFVAVTSFFACDPSQRCTGSNCQGGTGGAAQQSLDCDSRCIQHATTCGAPQAQASSACSELCALAKTEAQVACLEAQGCQTTVAAAKQACGLTGGAGGGSATSGAQQDESCKCQADTPGNGGGSFECAGSDICSPGLWCIGTRVQGVDQGTCRPVCCDTKESCTTNLGKEANCGSNHICECRNGIECVGDQCTCLGGFVTSIAYCYKK